MRDPRDPLRQQLAYEAARIAADEHLPDLTRACRKAAARIGCANKRCWPTREEIEEALRCQRLLFQGGAEAQALDRLRRRAVEAMDFLASFRPHLVGAGLDGTADRYSPIELHLFVDDPTEVAARLAGLRIPWQDGEKTLRFGGGQRRTQPVFRFLAGDTAVELVVFEEQGIRQAPLTGGNRRPMPRADRHALLKLLSGTEESRRFEDARALI